MPNVRVGCHTGPLVAGFMQIGSTPRYDAFGPTMQVAARMQATAAAGKIHCSEEFKEMLDVADKNFDYEFDVQRRTILKGRVTHPSYVMRSAHVPVPEDFIASLQFPWFWDIWLKTSSDMLWHVMTRYETLHHMITS